jgi:predicted Zn-dependent protease
MGYLNDEAQFAGVLGHEIGHVTARHAVEQQRNATLGQIGILAGMVISPTIAQFGQALSQGYSLLLLKYSRDDERQADELGVEYSTKIGYDAKEMANFFQTLQRISQTSGQEELPPFLSTHPDPGDRYNTVTKLAAQWKANTGLTNPAINRNAYLQKIDGIIYGEDPKEGYLEGNTFYHPVMKFQITRPNGWGYSNSPQQVQFAAPDGKAGLILTMAQGNSLQAAAQAFVQQYQMTVTRSGATTVNGLQAYVVEASLQQQQGTIATISYFIQYNNAIYQLLGVSSAADFPAYANTIVNSIMTFRELTDASKLNKQPERIRVRPAPTTGTLQQELSALGVPQARLNEMAIVNGMNLTTQVQAGTLIKVLGTGTL